MLVAIGYDDHVSMTFHALFTFMAHINSTANPIFYILLNPAFKKSFQSLKVRLCGAQMRSMMSGATTSTTNQQRTANMKMTERSNSVDTGSTNKTVEAKSIAEKTDRAYVDD
jgi:hypothetical protein